jgi:hypothetical protein
MSFSFKPRYERLAAFDHHQPDMTNADNDPYVLDDGQPVVAYCPRCTSAQVLTKSLVCANCGSHLGS